jgi:hypothetical protein
MTEFIAKLKFDLNGLGARCIAMLICLVPVTGTSAAPSVGSTPGIVTIPTARFVMDRDLVVGVGYLPSKYAVLRDPDFGDQIYYSTVGFLPFVEATIGIVRSDHVGNRWGIGDRIIHFRFKVISESKNLPGIVLGLHDPLGFIGETHAQHFNATYLVASKGFSISRTSSFSLHLGYGGDWIPAQQHQFVGVFGGIEISPMPHSSILLEYDALKFSAGLRVDLFKNVQGTINLFGMDRFGGGLSYRIRI